MMDSDSSSSYTSSSGDSEAMKEYVKAMSPTPSPATPKASFDNLFTEAGLESDDETSQPSGASTSGSSEESKDAPAAKRAPSPRPPPGAKLAPPMSAFKSSLGGSDSSSGSSDMSEMAPKHESMAKGFSEFMQDHPESRKEDSSSGSSRSSDTGSRSSGHEGDHSDRRSETRSDSQSSGSGGSSRTPSHPSQSQRSASSRGSSKEDSVSRSSRKDSEKSSRSGESSKTPSESESRRSASSHGSSKEDSVSRSSRNDSEKSSRSHESSKTPSQSESRRSKSSRSGSLRETSMASPSSRSDTDNKSPKSDRSSNSPSRPRSQKSSSSYEVSSDRDNEKSKSSPRSSDSESKGQDSNSRNEPLEESLNQESMTSKPEAVPSVGSKSSSKSGSHGALRAASPKSVRSGGEGSNSFTSARSRSVHSASVSKENSQKDSFASARSKQSEPSSRSSVRSAPKNSSDAHASKQSASSPIEKEMPPKIGAQDNESGLHGKTEASTRTSLSKKESSSVPKSPPDNESGRSSNSRSPEGSKVSKTSLVIEGKDNISPQASASRPSILQRLEARRRALQNQPSARSQGSSLGSKAKEKKPEETEKVEQVSMKESLQVADVQISLSKDLQQRPSSGEKPVQKARDETSKLESQSEDYDPRKNDVDEWKALIKRSAKSSPESKERQQGQIGPPPKLAENVENFRDPNDDDGWMPPALTTYGENKYKPENSDERLLPPAHRATAPTKDPTVTVRKPQDPTENETHLMKKNDALQQSTPTPPVPEIEVRPPPEDESSLGSCAFLFPREAVPDKSQAVKGEQIVTHKLKPTVAGVDYDYYRTWMLCGSKQPPAHQTRSEEVGREDPPGTTTIFKPKRVISDPVSYAHHQESGHAPLITAPIILPESPKKPPSETWAPNRPTYTPLRAKPADEWEAWKQARMHAAREESSETSAKKSTKSDSSSSESTWAPPTTIQGSTFASTRSKGSRSAPVVISWVPPSQASSVDFTGAVKSQPTSSTRARSAYKDPRGKSKASPVVEDVSTSTSSDSTPSSKNASLSGSTSTSGSTSPSRNSSSRKSESKTRPHAQSSPEKQPSRHSGGSSSSDSGTNTSSEDTNALFTSSKENTAVIATQLLSTAHTDSSAPVRVDIEQGTSPKTTVHSAAAKQRFSRPVVCLCIILSILVLGGVATAAVFVLTDKIGGDPTPTPGGAPTPPFPTAAPVQFTGTDELKTLVVTASPGTESDFVNPASAQSLALDWLSKNQFLNTYSDETKLQRFALATIFYSTDGDSWTQNDLWLSDIDECDWYSSENIDEVCGSGGNLDEVDLKSNNLRGKLPWTQLASLASDLLILDLQDNGLSGPIQNVVADLSSLLLFDVRGNEFSGTIPSGLGQLIDARQLDLSQNRLTGRIPSELSSMTSLESLWLNDNFLSGDIPSELGRLSSLRNMYLSGNDFVGTMPEEICSLQLENLEVNCEVECACCTACGEGSTGSEAGGTGSEAGGTGSGSDSGSGSNNDLSGDPTYGLIVARYPEGAEALADASSPQRAAFEWLKSPSNAQVTSDQRLLQRYALASLFYVTGGTSWRSTASWLSEADECLWYTTAETGMLCDSDGNLLEINLRNNNLQGSLPMELLLLANTLETLDLQGNAISGSIPSSIEGLNRVEQINLSSNSLFGIIPSEMGLMTNLRRIVLSDNNLFSTIPTEVGSLSQLVLLDLGSNQLTGTIPETLGSIQGLAGISLYKNFLSGTIPAEFSNLRNLQLLYADENDLSGPIPSSVCQLGLEEFWSDCQETQCTCCTTCCSDGAGCI